MEPDLSAAGLVAGSDGLLLDFDGPICHLYAGANPNQIAETVAAQFGLTHTPDPLDLIRKAVLTGDRVREVDAAITTAEIEAAASAVETPGTRELIERYGGPIAVVSNNSTAAIDAFLRRAGLREAIMDVTGRDPDCMKPHPSPMLRSASAIGVPIDRCVFVGDSVSDIEAARNAQCAVIALANKPTKRDKFRSLVGDPLVISSMVELLQQV